MTNESESRREFEAFLRDTVTHSQADFAWETWQASRAGLELQLSQLKEHDRIGWHGHEVLYEMIEGKPCPEPKAALGLATSAVDELKNQLDQARAELADDTYVDRLRAEIRGLRSQLEEATLERERLRFKLFYFESFKGTSHRTSCTI